jgi:hypothetical protein
MEYLVLRQDSWHERLFGTSTKLCLKVLTVPVFPFKYITRLVWEGIDSPSYILLIQNRGVTD